MEVGWAGRRTGPCWFWPSPSVGFCKRFSIGPPETGPEILRVAPREGGRPRDAYMEMLIPFLSPPRLLPGKHNCLYSLKSCVKFDIEKLPVTQTSWANTAQMIQWNEGRPNWRNTILKLRSQVGKYEKQTEGTNTSENVYLLLKLSETKHVVSPGQI